MTGRTDGLIVFVFMAAATVTVTCSELTTLSLALERGSKPFLYLVI